MNNPAKEINATLDSLCAAWTEAKRLEQEANKSRLKIESEIIKITGCKTEGSQTSHTDQFKITTTGKITRTMDWDEWEKVKDQIPEDIRPIKTKEVLDEVGVKWLFDNNREIYSLLPLVVKPAKPGVGIVAIAEPAK